MSTGEQQRWRTALGGDLPAGLKTEAEITSGELGRADANVLGVRVDTLNMERTLARIKEARSKPETGPSATLRPSRSTVIRSARAKTSSSRWEM